MSNRWPRQYDPEDRTGRRHHIPLRERYLPPEREPMSPIVIIILALAVFICLVICTLVMLIPLRLLITS